MGGGGQEAARDFAVALERFLNPQAPEPLLHEVDGGYLSTVTLFRGQPLSSFRLTPGVDLLILPPGRQSAPVLSGVAHYLTVGPDLQLGGRFRTPAAVLTSSDILRLARLRTGRMIELARIAGRQWPLAALGVGGPAGIARLLDQDEDRPWYLLAWLCHLIGEGGSAAAEDLLFQTGADAHVLYTLLTNFVAVGRGTTSDDGGVAGSGPRPRDRATVGLEGVVLRDCPDPAARAAFWAALMVAPPGTTVSLDSIIIAAVLSPAGDDADWEPMLTRGFSALCRQWFVDGVEDVSVRLRPIGALAALRSMAERRLAECGQELSGPVPDPQTAVPESWSIQRYALSEGWPTFDLDRQPAKRDVSVLADLRRDPDALVGAVRNLSGPCDVGAVAESIIRRGRVAFPGVEFRIEMPDGLRVAAPERALLTILFELLANALEATAWNGAISVSARVEGPDVLVDVMDDGPGLDESILRSAQVFRPGFSTRGPERGLGLNLARRVTDAVQGELEVANRSGGHPVFTGAHLTLILPGAVTPKP
ncbi:ATP-binding protein [Mycolicibacterium sp. P1-5]|nr:ATP-binding protein [Mycolicibacterium sp. P1-5]